MRLLLDTSVFVWAAREPARLGPARVHVADPSNVRLLSAASAWEIAIKTAQGKLPLPRSATDWVAEQMEALVCQPLPIEFEHVLAAGELPFHHRDPFDRLLVAQALALRIPLVTADRGLAAYGIEVIPTS